MNATTFITAELTHDEAWEQYDAWDESITCEYCGGDGCDPLNDYALPCPNCEGHG